MRLASRIMNQEANFLTRNTACACQNVPSRGTDWDPAQGNFALIVIWDWLRRHIEWESDSKLKQVMFSISFTRSTLHCIMGKEIKRALFRIRAILNAHTCINVMNN